MQTKKSFNELNEEHKQISDKYVDKLFKDTNLDILTIIYISTLLKDTLVEIEENNKDNLFSFSNNELDTVCLGDKCIYEIQTINGPVVLEGEITFFPNKNGGTYGLKNDYILIWNEKRHKVDRIFIKNSKMHQYEKLTIDRLKNFKINRFENISARKRKKG